MTRLRGVGAALLGVTAFHLLWQLLSALLHVSALPTPMSVYKLIPTLLSNGVIDHILASLWRLTRGLSISAVIALVIGILMGRLHLIDRLLSPMVYLAYPVPKMALLPIAMLLFGLGDGSKVLILVLITVFPMIVSVRDAVRGIPASYYGVLTAMGASSLQKLRSVTLLAILPELLTAVKLSVGTALSVLFFAENFGTKRGLGYFIQDSWMRLDYPAMYAGILLLALIGLMVFALTDIFFKIIKF